MTDAAAIGVWLMREVREAAPRRAYQSTLVRRIRDEFGEGWTYKNHNQNLAISKAVLKEFGKLKDELVIWDRSDQSWRIVGQDELDRLNERDERQRVHREEVKARKAEWEASRSEPR